METLNIPATWGHDIEVPDSMLNLIDLLSSRIPEGGAIGEKAAKISTPGALMAGFIIS